MGTVLYLGVFLKGFVGFFFFCVQHEARCTPRRAFWCVILKGFFGVRVIFAGHFCRGTVFFLGVF